MFRSLCLFSTIAAVPMLCSAEMMSMDDGEMSSVSGQNGLALDIGAALSVDAISYFDDNNGVSLRNVKIGATNDPNGQGQIDVELSVTDTQGIFTRFDIQNTRLVIGDITFSDDSTRSLGTFIFDYNLEGNVYFTSNDGRGLRINADYSMTNSRAVFRDNGNEFILDNIDANVSIRDMIFTVAVDPSLATPQPFLNFRLPNYQGNFSIGAIRFSNNPANFGRSTDINSGQPLASYGGIRGDFDASSDYRIYPGGRQGNSGLTLDIDHDIHSANFYYSDDGKELALKNISGSLDVDRLTLDVASGADGRLGLLLALDRLQGQLQIGSIEAGTSGKSFGSVGLDFVLEDQTIDGQIYHNQLLVRGQGHPDAGNQGFSIDAQWSMPEATVRYTDDGNAVYLSGIRTYGAGTVTLDVTKEEVRNGTQFFDGLRVGFNDLKGSYSIDGLRVGKEDAPLQGGTELLLALEIFPAYDFTLNGHYTFAPGGAAGEGITINADLRITEGNAALISDENGKGVWAAGLDYDIHLRDMTIDVTDQGLAIVQAESWSTMDISDLRIGDKVSGGSLGRVVLQRYETGSSIVLSPGGAGDVCVGGAGSNRGGCQATGGIWEERGEQGVTVQLKQIFAEAQDETRRNRFVWETNRRVGADGKAVNGSGTQVIVDNITTNDGVDGSNEYGFRNDISVDVYQTKVVKKTSGYDENGVYGERGQEKIMDTSAPEGYRYASINGPNDPQLADRPLGFAVKARTHFKELSIDTISLKHPDVAQPDTIIHGMKFQNFDITSNLTATPIQ